MRIVLFFCALCGITIVLYSCWDFLPTSLFSLENTARVKTVKTLEVRYTPEHILSQHKRELIKNNDYSLLEPKLTFYPYLLMEIKYTKDVHNTEEGVLLWGLTDGEMVIDTASWEKTHGFEDCLIAKASKNDFKILTTLVEQGGSMDHDALYQSLKVDTEIIDAWVESCRRKKLVVVLGNTIRLHFQNPKLKTSPITRLEETLVTVPACNVVRAPKKYSAAQLSKLSTIAFGHDFAIRKMGELFLPVYSISIQNPDGSVLTTHWNALNGKRMETF